jgi:hypothetical protein
MTKPRQLLSTANLQKVLDILQERASWADCMKCIGGSERLAFDWRAKCIKAMKAADLSSPFWMEWRGEFDWWVNHAGRARKEHLIATEAKIRAQAKDGIEEPIFGPDQRPIWKESARYLHRDDDFIRLSEGLDADADVTWYRYEHDEQGRPVQLTKRVNIPAPLRKAVLAASHSDYREQLDVNVEHSGTVHVSKPMERLASEPRADVSELRRLASMTPEQRRAHIGGSAYPKNPRTGLVMAAATGSPRGDNRSDHVKEQQPVEPPVNPRMYEAPAPNNPPTAPRPSYAKPSKTLDRGEGIGRGVVPDGGMKVA